MAKYGKQKLTSYERYLKEVKALREKYKDFPGLKDILNEETFNEKFNKTAFEHTFGDVLKQRGIGAERLYAEQIAGLNVDSIQLGAKAAGELNWKFKNMDYANKNLVEMFALLRKYYPNDEDYDNIFSPKESAF